jgi:MOSC domain-containing protein YiiM
VDPATGVRDIEVVDALRAFEGHLHCGVYVHVVEGGVMSDGDAAETLVTEPPLTAETGDSAVATGASPGKAPA